MTHGKTCGGITLFQIMFPNCILLDSRGLECVVLLRVGMLTYSRQSAEVWGFGIMNVGDPTIFLFAF